MTTSPKLRPAPPALPLDAWCTAREAALIRRCALSTFWNHVRAGLVPPPTYLSPRAPRWRVRDMLSAPPAAGRRPEAA